MAGDEGFEPPITGPEPVALPLGQSPLACSFMSFADTSLYVLVPNGTIYYFLGLRPQTAVTLPLGQSPLATAKDYITSELRWLVPEN